MDQERTVNKLLFNILHEHIDIKTALEQAYGAGYDAREKDYNQSQEKPVIQEDREHKMINRFDSMSDARKRVGMSKTGMIGAIKHKLLTRKGYYFRYAE